MNRFKNLVLLASIISMLASSVSQAQEIALDIDVMGFETVPRDIPFDSYRLTGGAILIQYSDTLSSKWDYRLGLGWASTLSFYSYDVIRVGVNIMGEVDTVAAVGQDRYSSDYLSLSAGAKYWFRGERKGFYVSADLMPIVLLSDDRRLDSYTSDGAPLFIENKGQGSYTSFNILLITSIGYKVRLFSGLAAHISFNAVFRGGDVVHGIDDSFRFTRGLTLGGSYTF